MPINGRIVGSKKEEKENICGIYKSHTLVRIKCNGCPYICLVSFASVLFCVKYASQIEAGINKERANNAQGILSLTLI
jgi:hypothetical protein